MKKLLLGFTVGFIIIVCIGATLGPTMSAPWTGSATSVVGTGVNANSGLNFVDPSGNGLATVNLFDGSSLGGSFNIISTNNAVAISGVGVTIAGGNGSTAISGSGGIAINNVLTTKAINKAVTPVSTSTAPGINNEILFVTTTGLTETLPTAVGILGRTYTYKLTASGSCTIATTSSQTIDASTTYSLSAQYKYVTVVSDGSNWKIIANN